MLTGTHQNGTESPLAPHGMRGARQAHGACPSLHTPASPVQPPVKDTRSAVYPRSELILTADSYTPLEGFPLRWRFTATRLGVPPDEIVARLNPLTADAAARAGAIAAARQDAAHSPLVSFRSDDRPGAVRDDLRALPVEASTQILLSWNASTALQTVWDIFVQHWDDFCYPASDDLVIWPIVGGWTLRYHHYEVFQFQGEAEAPAERSTRVK